MDNFHFNGSQISRGEVFQMFLRVSIASVITYYSVKWMMNQIDPTSKSKRKAKIIAEEQLKRQGLMNKTYHMFTISILLKLFFRKTQYICMYVYTNLVVIQ